ncbi:MAG: UDP-N-acetylglucosamine diphosphorylase/glucosamine-1-phosphate N-acetyltransferase [Gaiellales bacterium]|nr:MAG: UDP-N-acetylglucosamine diphosphorylase/glucosamine-1-phosphate N-acetyltransferase [Gaiellales bacterium]
MQSAPAEESRRPLAVIVLAAGLGTRMKSKTPKVLHHLCGKPMIAWVAGAVEPLGADRLLVVLGSGAEEVHQFLPERAEVVIQEEQRGTADAVAAAREALEGFEGDVLILYGDTPLLGSEVLTGLLELHARDEPACTMLAVEMDDPSHYGRVNRDADGRVTRVVEHRDASDAEKEIREVNAGVYVFEAAPLWEALSEIGSANDQGEYYLTDAVGILAGGGQAVMAHVIDDQDVVMGVNSRADLAVAAGLMRQRILERHMLAGVTVTDPGSTYVDDGVIIGRDTILEPMTTLSGRTFVGEDCVIGPSAVVVDSTIDDGVRFVSSYAVEASIAAGCTVGPFAYLRPGAALEQGAKAGTFVEIKNSRVGEGAKVPHLSYIGDAEIGAGANIGAGNITANYDGVSKHRTVIGSGVHTGADTVFVAPVEVGDGSMTGAGSVITEDIPGEALGIARSRQRNIGGFARRLSKAGRAGKKNTKRGKQRETP